MQKVLQFFGFMLAYANDKSFTPKHSGHLCFLDVRSRRQNRFYPRRISDYQPDRS